MSQIKYAHRCEIEGISYVVYTTNGIDFVILEINEGDGK